MYTSNKTLDLLIRNIIFIPIAFFIVIYWRWYWVNPISDSFPFGIILFGVYTFSVIIWKTIQRESYLRLSLLITASLFLLANIIHVVTYMPEVLDSATFNGVRYYISRSSEFIDNKYIHYHITKRWGLFNYQSNGLGSAKGNLRLEYDENTDKVIVIRRFPVTEILVYIDDDNPLFYGADVEMGGQKYYVLWSCNRIGEDCSILTHFLYMCELDNTSCKRLPFEYQGEYGHSGTNLEVDETTGEINVIFDVYVERQLGEVLIYTYGEFPRCYVDGCKIVGGLQ